MTCTNILFNYSSGIKFEIKNPKSDFGIVNYIFHFGCRLRRAMDE